MPAHPHELPPMFHFDVSPDSTDDSPQPPADAFGMVAELLRELVVGQERQNKLLAELLQQSSAAQRQRAAELEQWKAANPDLARRCRTASETLSQIQNEFVDRLTDEVLENEESLLDGEFMLTEFVDRFGPRLAHLGNVQQLLSQLGHIADPASQT